MNLWRVLILSPLLLLGGCLVTFDKPIEPAQAAPLPLLGEWSGEDEWGEQRFLDITQLGGNRYRAVSTSGSPDNAEGREEIDFTVAQHGRRWYLCASVPAQCQPPLSAARVRAAMPPRSSAGRCRRCRWPTG